MAGLGRPRRTAFGDALHELRRRGCRDQRLPPSVVQRHRQAPFSHRCTWWNALARRAGGRDRPARRVRAPGIGPTIRPTMSPTTVSAWARRGSCSLSTRSRMRPATAPGARTPEAGAARLRALTGNGHRPLPQGSEHPNVFETGFLNGSAGAAFVFLERYAHDHGRVDLETATRLLGWVNDQAETDGRGGLRWPLADDNAAAAVRLRARYRRHRLGQPAGGAGDPATAPTVRSRGARVWLRGGCPAAACGTSCRRPRHPGSRQARQRRRGDRLGARRPCARRARSCCESSSRAVGACRAARARRARRTRRRCGTRARPLESRSWPPSRRGTGAPRESPRSRPVLRVGPGQGPGGQRTG